MSYVWYIACTTSAHTTATANCHEHTEAISPAAVTSVSNFARQVAEKIKKNRWKSQVFQKVSSPPGSSCSLPAKEMWWWRLWAKPLLLTQSHRTQCLYLSLAMRHQQTTDTHRLTYSWKCQSWERCWWRNTNHSSPLYWSGTVTIRSGWVEKQC